MKKLFFAFAFVGLVACGSQTPTSTSATSSSEAPAARELEAMSGVCPTFAPKCCGLLRDGGVCVGNCVAIGAPCP